MKKEIKLSRLKNIIGYFSKNKPNNSGLDLFTIRHIYNGYNGITDSNAIKIGYNEENVSEYLLFQPDTTYSSYYEYKNKKAIINYITDKPVTLYTFVHKYRYNYLGFQLYIKNAGENDFVHFIEIPATTDNETHMFKITIPPDYTKTTYEDLGVHPYYY